MPSARSWRSGWRAARPSRLARQPAGRRIARRLAPAGPRFPRLGPGRRRDLGFRVCDPVDDARWSEIEPRLSETGLFEDIAADRVGRDVLAYTPAFELWVGGASKRRWLRLPPGTRIDTSDLDAWQFPVGT